MAHNQKSMYTEAQWRWLHEKYVKGYSLRSLAQFAVCHPHSIQYHWDKLGLPCTREYLGALCHEEFKALGEDAVDAL